MHTPSALRFFTHLFFDLVSLLKVWQEVYYTKTNASFPARVISMNYRHIYHAGSFADVAKHFILTLLIDSLKRKESGFTYLDTHAGVGLYDLQDPAAIKTTEATSGIQQLIMQNNIPAEINDYINIIKQVNNELGYQIPPARFYPGSAMVVKKLLRPQDNIIINELHPEDFLELKRNFKYDKQATCHKRDAYEFLPAILPVKRGLTLIDPPYEEKNEYEKIIACLKKSLQRWPNGIYAIWFPIKNENTQILYDQLLAITQAPILITELTIKNAEELGLLGTGLIIINPPWQIEAKIEPVLAYLWKLFSPEKLGHYFVKSIQIKN